MADLAGAIRTGGGDFKKTELKIGYGAHRGYFVGLGDTIIEQSNFGCKVCKGNGTLPKGDECRACKGSGRKTMTKVPIQYQMGPTLIQEEWVTYALSEPGTLQDGTPKSGSTLWSRMKALSGLSTPAEQSQWYAELPKPIKIPVEIMVVDNERGDAHVIASVRRINPRPASGVQHAPEPQEEELDESSFDFNDPAFQ